MVALAESAGWLRKPKAAARRLVGDDPWGCRSASRRQPPDARDYSSVSASVVSPQDILNP